jgi:hypothetical protein
MKTKVVLMLIAPSLFLAPMALGVGEGSEPKDDQKPTKLTVVNEADKTTLLSAEDLAKLPQQTIKVKDHAGTLVTYEGVSLAEVLRAAGVALGKELKGPLLANGLSLRSLTAIRWSLPCLRSIPP